MENKNQTMLQRGITLLIVIIGNAMYAAVAVLFLLPSGLRRNDRYCTFSEQIDRIIRFDVRAGI